MEQLQKTYCTLFGQKKADLHIFSPYRVCPLGAHSDHQLGIVTGMTFDKGIDFLFSRTENGNVQLVSLSFQGLLTLNVHQPPLKKQKNWGDYIRGAVLSLTRDFNLSKGIKGVIKGSIPVGGLSSSAALLCGFIMALTKVNSIELTKLQIINYASYTQRQFIGLRNGILDQGCVVLSESDKLLYLDTQTKQYQQVLFNQTQGTLPFQIAVFFSGVTRKLTQTNFNMRVAQCKTSAWMLYSYQGRKLKQLEDTHLREIDVQIFNKHKDKMPQSFKKRATHFYSEFDRVKKGVEYWKKGDIKQFGKLMFESCESSIVNYECASPELKSIYQIMKNTEGVYGGRFSGAGFKGACVAIVDSSKKHSIQQKMRRQYLQKFPEYKDSFKIYFCKSVKGVDFY